MHHGMTFYVVTPTKKHDKISIRENDYFPELKDALNNHFIKIKNEIESNKINSSKKSA